MPVEGTAKRANLCPGCFGLYEEAVHELKLLDNESIRENRREREAIWKKFWEGSHAQEKP